MVVSLCKMGTNQPKLGVEAAEMQITPTKQWMWCECVERNWNLGFDQGRQRCW
jgi:hypothetical protein